MGILIEAAECAQLTAVEEESRAESQQANYEMRRYRLPCREVKQQQPKENDASLASPAMLFSAMLITTLQKCVIHNQK